VATSAELWVLRHGQTAWSEAGRHTGRTDVPLTVEGEEQARAISGRIASVEFDLVLASPLERAYRTAQLAGAPGIALEPQAVEWDYGDYEGLTRQQICANVPDWSPWTHPKMPGGETLDELAARARGVVERVRTVVPCSSRTATSCACSPCAGSGRTPPSPATSCSDRRASASSGTTVTSLPWSAGTPDPPYTTRWPIRSHAGSNSAWAAARPPV
jgi:hypothetical protein